MSLAPGVQRSAAADLLQASRSLAVLGEVLADEIGAAFLELLAAFAENHGHQVAQHRARLFHLLATEAELYPEPLTGDAWQNHLLDRLLGEESPFSLKAQRAPFAQLGPSLVSQTRQDLVTLRALFEHSERLMHESTSSDDPEATPAAGWDQFQPLLQGAPRHGPAGQALKLRLAREADWPSLMRELAEFYYRHGSGLFGRCRAFRWTRRGQLGHLEGISHPDPIRLRELIAYDHERELLLENTEQFLDGFPANNVLLYGDRGTGKSSTLKALLSEYGDRGLRLIEVPKQLLADFPAILALVRGRRERFIVFVDDLSFDEHETLYKELKAVLEGTLEARPENVLVYATSNRRHLIVERFSDHDAPSDAEIHRMDTVQEKLSLSDRFGLRLLFLSPDQQRYLEIVNGLVEQRGLRIEAEELRRRALQWATWQNGRSGRTARQFVDHLTGALARQSRSARS